MGKKQKIRTGTGDIVSTPGPLHRQIEKANLATQKYKTPKKKHGGWTAAGHIDPKLSSKIILEAHKQLEEEVKSATKAEQEEGEEGSAEEFDEQGEHLAQQSDELNAFISQIEEEEAVTGTKQNGTKLFEVIQRKKELHAKEDVHKADELHQLDPTVDKLYTEVGQLLEKYRSGKVPKAFKIIPSLLNWEQVLELTCPEKWTAAAMLQATKIFASTGTPTQCQKFYSLVLLPRIRDEIDEYKKLHFHMYQCLFKAMFKPAAFFKGFLLPLCRSGTCTLREAVVFGSVLRKISIPQMHAAAAMLSIAEMDYNSSNMHLLRILIEKNYTLPFRALDGLVFQFLKMRSHYDELPVSWHQCLLIFAQIYAKDLSSEQRDALIELTKLKTHHQLTPEIQKVLRSTNSRNEESEANVPDYAKEDEEMDI